MVCIRESDYLSMYEIICKYIHMYIVHTSPDRHFGRSKNLRGVGGCSNNRRSFAYLQKKFLHLSRSKFEGTIGPPGNPSSSGPVFIAVCNNCNEDWHKFRSLTSLHKTSWRVTRNQNKSIYSVTRTKFLIALHKSHKFFQ